MLAMLVFVPCWRVAVAADVNPALLDGMKWRQIGPFRGGRVVAVSGVPGDPATWYFGGVAGESQRQVYAYLHGDQLAKWRTVSDTDLPTFLLMRDHGVPCIAAMPQP